MDCPFQLPLKITELGQVEDNRGRTIVADIYHGQAKRGHIAMIEHQVKSAAWMAWWCNMYTVLEPHLRKNPQLLLGEVASFSPKGIDKNTKGG